MLLTRITSEYLEALSKKDKQKCAFVPEAYQIFFKYDTAAGTLNYYAALKDLSDRSLPIGFYFSIAADLTVKRGETTPWYSFLVYLRAAEKKMPEEEQKALYGEAYYTLGAVAGLSKAEMADREKARRSFLSFMDSLENKGLMKKRADSAGTVHLGIEIVELPEKANCLVFRLKVGRDKKLYYIKDANDFCQTIIKGGEVMVTSKFSLRPTKEAFDPEWQPLMEHFIQHVNVLRGPGAFHLFAVIPEKIPGFLALLPSTDGDQVLYSEAGPWRVEKADTRASVSLDSAGTLSLVPDLSKEKVKKECFVGGLEMAVLYPGKRRAVLYRFAEQMHAELYNYFMDRPAAEVRYVSDLLAGKILPVSAGMMRTSDKNDFRITVHISLEDEMLAFETQYWIGEEKKSASFFEGKPFEQALIRSCTSILQDLHAVPNGKVWKGEDILFFLKSDLAPLRQVASVYLDERIRRLNICPAPAVQIRAGRQRGWLNLTFHSAQYTPEELTAIYRAYRQKKNFFLLKNDLILLEPEKMAPVEAIIEESGAEKSLEDVKLPFYHAMLLEGYREDGADIAMDDWVTEAVTRVVDYKNAPLPVTEELKDILRPYQADGVRWMSRLSKYGLSGILADDMGLGKTLEVLAFLSQSHYDRPVLVVCPKSLVYNWLNEIKKWLRDVPVVIIAGQKNARLEKIAGIVQKEKTIYITGYDSLRADIDAYEKKKFFLVLADEAQNIKNAWTQRAKAIRKLDSQMHLALTGTPVENSLTDLWSIFDFLMPGYLGTAADFRGRYETGENLDSARKILARKVQPFLLRRAKEEVLDALPGKEVILVTVSMADEQRRLYEAYLQRARELAKEEKGVSIFSALTRLRQICVDPSVFLEDYAEMSAKLSVALDQVMSSIEGGHRVLVFSSFTSVLEHFRYYLEEQEIHSYYINGDTPGQMRVSMAEKFNTEDRIKVMLISIKAGGTGLNLIGADIVIHLDPWWNFAVEEQATDRAYRIGQTKPVTVYKLIAHDSVEEKVVALQEEKRRMSSDVVETSISGIDTFTAEDIRYILE